MVECLLDDVPRTLGSSVNTWGELLDGVDGECATALKAVTAVRFNGVDQPTFRSPEIAQRELSSLGRVEIHTTDRRRLLGGALGTARQSLPALAAGACRTARAFRGADLSSAHDELTALVEAIRTLTLLSVAMGTAAGVDLEQLPCGADSAADVLGGVGVALDTMSQWQSAQDWVALADAIEFDLAPALLAWERVFDAVDDRCTS